MTISVFFIISQLTFTTATTVDQTDYYLDIVYSGTYTNTVHESFLTKYQDESSLIPLGHFLEARLNLNDYNYNDAYINLTSALETVDKSVDKRLYAETLYYLAELEFYFYDYPNAINHNLLLYEVAQTLEEKHLLIESIFNLADSYAYNFDYKESAEWADYGLALSKEEKYPLGDAHYYAYLFYVNNYDGRYVEAIKMLERALDRYPDGITHYVAVDLTTEYRRIIGGENILNNDNDKGALQLETLLEELDPNDYVSRYKINLSLGDYYTDIDLNASINYNQQALLDYRAASLIPTAFTYESTILEYIGYSYYELKDYINAADFFYESIISYQNNTTDNTIDSSIENLDTFKFEQFNKQLSLLQQLNYEKEQHIRESSRLTMFLMVTSALLLIALLITYVEYRGKTKAQEKLYRLSITDSLTQVFNRGHILQLFEKVLSPSSAIIILDLDNFKFINDTYGHLIGDEVLVKIARVIKSSLREGDYLGRYGGEEFLIVLNNTDQSNLVIIAERIRENIESITWSHADLKTTASIGATLCFSEDLEEVLHKADQLMYQAKNTGKNRIATI